MGFQGVEVIGMTNTKAALKRNFDNFLIVIVVVIGILLAPLREQFIEWAFNSDVSPAETPVAQEQKVGPVHD